jgi:hypothetical protein
VKAMNDGVPVDLRFVVAIPDECWWRKTAAGSDVQGFQDLECNFCIF